MDTRSDTVTRLWFPLDNAANLFPTVISARVTTIFRLSMELTEPVRVAVLQEALEHICPRFRYYLVQLKRGFFWYYFEENPGMPRVIEDSAYPCMEMPIKKARVYPFRVRAHKNRIAVEFSHMLTDGTGALTFLRALVGEYLSLLGVEVSDWGDIFRPGTEPDPEEWDDSFKRYYRKGIPVPKSIPFAFHVPFPLERKGVYHLITGIIPLKAVLEKTKARGVTITEFVAALYIDAVQSVLKELSRQEKRAKSRIIRLMVPVNLRNIFPSKTMRNFSLYVLPGIDTRLGDFSFDEILKAVHHYMRGEVNEKLINQQIARNVGSEYNTFIRMIPLFLKRLFGRSIYNRMGEFLYSGCLTNLGAVTMPKELVPYIQSVEFVPAPSPVTKTNCAVVSFVDFLYINFGRLCRDSSVERHFFQGLVRMGIPVRILTNE